jgi:uncharacterized protein with GYD domain
MPTYISLINYTDQGIRSAKASVERQQQVEAQLQQLGGRFIENYLTMGEHDYVLIWEAPDDETAARFMLTVGAAGNIRTRTLRAFPRDEAQSILRSFG